MNLSSTGFDFVTEMSSELFTDVYTSHSVFEVETTTQNNNLTNPQKTQLLIYDILIPTLGSLIIVLNFAVVLSSGLLLKKGTQPRSTYLFLGNVAMCDLVTGCAVLLGQLYPKSQRNQIMCAFQLGLIVSSTLTSIYSVGLIAIDRYLYIIHGLQYQRWVYPTRARVCILIIWFIGCVVGFLPIMGWSGDTQNGKICWFIKLVPPKLIMMTCVIGLIPIIVVIILYSIILYHAIRKVVQLRQAANTTGSNQNPAVKPNDLRIFIGRKNVTDQFASNGHVSQEEQSQPKKGFFRRIFMKKPKPITDPKAPSKAKAITVVLLVTGSFVITWVPYFGASFLYVNCDPKETPKKCKNLQVLIASPLAILGFCNSLLNPIIYAWWHNGFRNSIKKMFRRNKNKVTVSSSSNTSKRTNTASTTKNTSISSSSDQAQPEQKMEEVDLNAHI